MRFISTNHIASALLAAALILPVAARAATDPAPAAPAASSGEAAMPAGGHREKVEQRIADMHATLHITDAQLPQWNAFAQVMLDNAQSMEAVIGKNTGAATQNAKEIMQSYAAIAGQHAQNVQKLSAAFDTLYAGLTADQQKAADEMFRAKAEQHAQKQGG